MITMMKKTMTITLESQAEIDLFTSLISSLTGELCEKFGLHTDWASDVYMEFYKDSVNPLSLIPANIDIDA